MLDWAAAALEERQALVPGLLAAIDLSRDMSTDRLKAVRRHPACSGGTDDAARMAISAALLDVYERRADRGHGSAPRSATRRRRNRGNRGGGGGAAGSSGGAAAGAQQRSGGGGQQAAGAAAAALTQQGALALLNDPVLLEHVVAELVTAQFQRRRDL